MIIDNSSVPCFPVYNVREDGSCSCGNVDCSAIGKHPKLKNWGKQFTYPKQHDFINNNYGIPTGSPSQIIIVDVDPRNGGFETFAALSLDIGGFDDTIKADTPSGGFHLYYQIPNDIDFVIRKQILGNGIDLLGEGAFAVMVDSNHVKGVYKWAEGLSPSEQELETIPLGLLSILEANANKKAHDDASVAKGEQSIDSVKLAEIAACLNKLAVTGYQQWLEVAMALHSIGNQGRAPFDLWIQWSQNNDPKNGWRDSDVRKWNSFKAGGAINYKKIFELAKLQGLNPGHFQTTIVDQELDKSLDALAKKMREPQPIADVIEIDIPKKVTLQNDLPPGYAADLIQALYDQLSQTTPQHVLTTMVTQVLPASIFQGLVCTPMNKGSISAYNLIIGPQGSGKTDVINNVHAIRKFVMLGGDEKMTKENRKAMGNSPWPVSSGALMQAFGFYNPMFLTNDELLANLSSCYQKSIGNNSDKMLSNLLSAWSTAKGGLGLMGQTAMDADYDQNPVDNPMLSMFGGGVSSSWHELSANKGFMANGIGTRFEITEWGKLIIPKRGLGMNRRVKIGGHLLNLLSRQKDFYQYLLDQKNISIENRMAVTVDPKVMSLMEDFHIANLHKVNQRDFTDSDTNESRLAELAWRSASRLACLNASVSADRKSLNGFHIDMDMIDWSIDYVTNRFQFAEQEADRDRTIEGTFTGKLMTFLRKRRTGVNVRQISHALGKRSKMNGKERRYVLDELVDSGDVKRVKNLYLLPHKTFPITK